MGQFGDWICHFLQKNQLAFHQESSRILASYFPIFVIFDKKLILHLIDLENFIKLKLPQTYFSNFIDEAEKSQFSVLTIWEDYWYRNPEKLEAILRAKLLPTPAIYGRKTQAERISNPELTTFLQKNHMATPLPAKYKFGLRDYSGELMAVASFSYGRKIKRNQQIYRSFELLRFCNRQDIRVHGGFGKLITKFIQELDPDDIMTYADRDWSAGKVYQKAQFQLIEMTPPQKFYIHKKTLERFHPKKIPKNITIQELIQVFNAGNQKYLRLLK